MHLLAMDLSFLSRCRRHHYHHRCLRRSRRRQFYGFHQPLLNAIKVEQEDIQPTKQETNK